MECQSCHPISSYLRSSNVNFISFHRFSHHALFYFLPFLSQVMPCHFRSPHFISGCLISLYSTSIRFMSSQIISSQFNLYHVSCFCFLHLALLNVKTACLKFFHVQSSYLVLVQLKSLHSISSHLTISEVGSSGLTFF